MTISIKFIGFSIALSYIIVIISCMLPMRKVNKVSLIDAIRGNKDSKLKANSFKTSKMIEKVFGIEGEMAYKNIRKDRSKYKTIVISIIVSIVLYLSVIQAFEIQRFDKAYGSKVDKSIDDIGTFLIYGEDRIEISNIIINELKDKGLITWYFGIDDVEPYNTEYPIDLKVSIPKDKLSEKGNILYKKGLVTLEDIGEEYLAKCIVKVAYGDIYENILKELGIQELNKNECIIFNTISDTKYGKKIDVSDFASGDKITVKETKGQYLQSIPISELGDDLKEKFNEINEAFGGGEKSEEHSNIVKEKPELILHNFELSVTGVYTDNVIGIGNGNFYPFCIIINEETAKEWQEKRKFL